MFDKTVVIDRKGHLMKRTRKEREYQSQNAKE